ncbi:MAG: sodium/solute symporter, partial [Deltaproteobacteria bacterium]|nr:sodium/solute symporter [Deltaproteobacteria bacterium]
MNWLDWSVIFIYLVMVIGIALWVMQRQKTIHDYYLAGRQVRWWQSGLSTMATQLGAISFVSAPAFVALKENGGFKWLSYEFGVPLGLIAVMWIIIPTLHRRNVISIYEYLEDRFDASTRLSVSLLFQVGRALASSVAVLAGGIILSSALSISTVSAIILVGVATIVYDVLGGIRVVILSDVFQMVIIVSGLVICGVTAAGFVTWEDAVILMSAERLEILDMKHWGMSPEGEYGFWPMLLGGIFLYASYYGCDQSQVQRELTVGSVDGVKKSLLFNAIGRFPLVLLYCILGILVGAVVLSPGGMERVGASLGADAGAAKEVLMRDPDRMVPLFVLSYLPHGLIGFVFVAIMAALMSSLDSALNSLSAVTIRDIYERYFGKITKEKRRLFLSKVCTLSWGVFCVVTACALSMSGEATRQTTIVLINAVGSLIYGPILAVFMVGMCTRVADYRWVNVGAASGLALNLCLWLFTPVSWLWWNVFGFATAFLIPLGADVVGGGGKRG